MPAEPSKYAFNQFETATTGSNPLMSEILADSMGRLTVAVTAKPALSPALGSLTSANTAWNNGETTLANAEAALLSATAAMTDKLASLTRKPDIDTNSPLEIWDTTIRGQVAYQGTTYTLLLPRGRETLTGGGIEEQLDALRDFGIRLVNQTLKPVLASLGGTVGFFASAARALRTTQLNAKGSLDIARANQETLRLAAATELYNMVGLGMTVFKATPDQIDTLFDVGLLRGPAQALPDAPADTFWNPAQRTLSTTALPNGATRLEAWREGPGGMPERLAVSLPGETSVLIPASITFNTGDLYQLWLDGLNSKGPGPAGPKVNWTAA